jgi:hypothetical protein
MIVLDDVWNDAHLQLFMRGGTRCARLITTRNRETSRAVPQHVFPIEGLSLHVATVLLASYLDERATQDKRLISLAQRLEGLALPLRLAGAMMRERVRRGDSVERAIEYAHNALDRRGITAFDRKDVVTRDQSLSHTLELRRPNS